MDLTAFLTKSDKGWLRRVRRQAGLGETTKDTGWRQRLQDRRENLLRMEQERVTGTN